MDLKHWKHTDAQILLGKPTTSIQHRVTIDQKTVFFRIRKAHGYVRFRCFILYTTFCIHIYKFERTEWNAQHITHLTFIILYYYKIGDRSKIKERNRGEKKKEKKETPKWNIERSKNTRMANKKEHTNCSFFGTQKKQQSVCVCVYSIFIYVYFRRTRYSFSTPRSTNRIKAEVWPYATPFFKSWKWFFHPFFGVHTHTHTLT